MSNRLAKVNSLIKKELGQLLQTGIERPRDFLVTIISVNTSVDLRHATVNLTVTPPNKSGSALKYMRSNMRELQSQLHKKIVMRPAPRLHIKIDEGEIHAARIEELIAKDKIGNQKKDV